MRRMKDSGLLGIGDIPADWEVIKTKFVLSYVKRPPQNHSEVVTCFRDGTVTLRSNKREEGFTFSDKEIGYQQIHVGDFVFHGMDGFAGSIGVSDSFGKASPVLIVCEQNKKSSNKYYCYYFRNLANNNVFEDAGNGVRIRSCDIRWNKLGNMYIIVPPLLSQHRIAAYLDAKCAEIDRSMELVRQSMDKLKAYKMSVITEAVTKGLDPDVPMKDSGVPWIGGIPEGWEIIRLKFIAPVQGGYSFKAEKFSTEHGIPLVRMNNLKRGMLNLEDAVKIQEEDIIEEFFINENDILIGLSGSLGDTGSLGNYAVASKGDLPCLLNQRVGRFIVSKSIKYKLIVYFLDTDFFKQPLILDSNGTAQFNISPYDIGEVLVPLPPRSEQQDIIAYLDTKCAEIDAIIVQKQALLDKLAAYKKSLIFECVTGKREVAA